MRIWHRSCNQFLIMNRSCTLIFLVPQDAVSKVPWLLAAQCSGDTGPKLKIWHRRCKTLHFFNTANMSYTLKLRLFGPLGRCVKKFSDSQCSGDTGSKLRIWHEWLYNPWLITPIVNVDCFAFETVPLFQKATLSIIFWTEHKSVFGSDIVWWQFDGDCYVLPLI